MRSQTSLITSIPAYYLRMFPEIPQKFISGFFSSLWGPDPHHSRWALVAKVYSFVRDEIGKEKISLSNFLDIACPLMKITDPASYLSTLGWHVQRTEGEVPQLIRHDSSAKPALKLLESEDSPTTEFDLLLAVLKVGFLPSWSSELIRKMSANDNALMTSSSVAVSRVHSDSTIEKLDFMSILREDPGEAAKKLFGQHYDENIIRETGYKIHDVESLSEIQHIPLHRPLDPRCFPYSNLQPQKDPNLNMPMDINGVTEHECYDVGNAHDLNAMIGFDSFLTDAALPTHSMLFRTLVVIFVGANVCRRSFQHGEPALLTKE